MMYPDKTRFIMQTFLTFVLAISLFACSNSDNADTDGDNNSGYDCPEGYTCNECLYDTECDAGMYCDQVDHICKPSSIDGDDDDDVAEVEDKKGVAMIDVGPLEVDFGSVQLGESQKEYVQIFNLEEATADLEIQNIQFVNEEIIDYTFRLVRLSTQEELSTPYYLDPNDNIQLEIIYSPSDDKDDTGEQILISSNDPDDSIIRVTLSPQYKGEARAATNPEALAIDDTPVGGENSLLVNILNKPLDSDANRVLKITGISLKNGTLVDDAFQLSPSQEISTNSPVYLAPNQSVQATLKFRPIVQGDYANTLVVTCNDSANGPNVEFEISAKGIEADLEVLPNPIEFMLTPIGISHVVPVEIRNTGNENYPIEAIEISDGTSYFTVDTNSAEPALPWNLAPNESGKIHVGFIPDSVDLTTGVLWIQAGGTKPDYFVELRGSGDDDSEFESKLPILTIRANGYESGSGVPPVKAGVPIVLDVIAEDPDGGTLLDYEFEIDSSPNGSSADLTGTGSSRNSTPNMDGIWTYRARVKDDEGDWSEWDSVSIRVDPPETLTMVLGDANLCANIYLDIAYHMSFINTEGEACGPPSLANYSCDWGPTHSGPCSGILHSDAGEEIVWDYSEFGGIYPPEVDGTYQIKVEHSLPLFGETVEVKLFIDGSSVIFWKGSHKFPLFLGDTDWIIYLKRVEGRWEEPYLCEPDGCGN